MIINIFGKGSVKSSGGDSPTGSTDVTEEYIMNNKIAYNSSNEKIIGTAPFEYIGTENNIDNYRVLEDEMYILLPNDERKLLKTGLIDIDDEWA